MIIIQASAGGYFFLFFPRKVSEVNDRRYHNNLKVNTVAASLECASHCATPFGTATYTGERLRFVRSVGYVVDEEVYASPIGGFARWRWRRVWRL